MRSSARRSATNRDEREEGKMKNAELQPEAAGEAGFRIPHSAFRI
jgi:hypothetical protein